MKNTTRQLSWAESYIHIEKELDKLGEKMLENFRRGYLNLLREDKHEEAKEYINAMPLSTYKNQAMKEILDSQKAFSEKQN